VCNGTAALHLACRAADVGPGDRVWTSPITFVASANCARYCGATVDFVDIDAATLNLSATALADKLVAARKDDQLPKAVVAVHFGGRSCDMEAIAGLAREFGFSVIEDASHALGATYLGQPVGSCRYSDITTTSFHPVKIITTGEGGLLTTRSDAIVERLRLLRNHGITRDSQRMNAQDQGAWYYEQLELGFNYRMTDIHAALGSSQMKRLPAFIKRRRSLARRYRQLLAHLPLALPLTSEESSWHLYPIRMAAARRREVFNAMTAAEIGVNVHYIPVHLQPDYRTLGFAPGQFPVAEHYYGEALTLPLHPLMSDADQDRVVAALAEALA
jgi:UDP-4-amino-4,6-dideoxy-N-acetyl-beta-L-altrosamine transaminase